MSKKTAVQKLISILESKPLSELTDEDWFGIKGQALEEEKEQIIDAWINGDARICETKSIPYAEQYYNETYNNVQQP
jgi:hypothetical protein